MKESNKNSIITNVIGDGDVMLKSIKCKVSGIDTSKYKKEYDLYVDQKKTEVLTTKPSDL